MQSDLSKEKWKVIEALPKDAPYRRKYVVVKENQTSSHQNRFIKWVYAKRFFDQDLYKRIVQCKGRLKLSRAQNLLLSQLFISKDNQEEVICIQKTLQNLTSLQQALILVPNSVDKIRWILQILSLFQTCQEFRLLGFIRQQNIKLCKDNGKIFITDFNFNFKNLGRNQSQNFITSIVDTILSQQKKGNTKLNQVSLNLESLCLSYLASTMDYTLKVQLGQCQQKKDCYYVRMTVIGQKCRINEGTFIVEDDSKLLHTFLAIVKDHEQLQLNIQHCAYLQLINKEKQTILRLVSLKIPKQKAYHMMKSLNFTDSFLNQQMLQILESQEYESSDMVGRETLNQQVQIINKTQENQNKYPYNCVGMIKTKMKAQVPSTSPVKKYFGTGVLLSPRLILTCAHNLCKFEGQNGKTIIYKVQQKQDIYFELGERYSVEKWQFCGQYQTRRINSQDYAHYDYALILLKDQVIRDQYPQIARNYDRNKQSVYVKGYAQRMITIQHNVQKHMVQSALRKGQIQSFSESFIDHNSQTQKGYSGSPLFVQFTTQTQFYFIVGVHIKKLAATKRAIYLQGETIENLILIQKKLTKQCLIFQQAIYFKQIFVPNNQQFKQFIMEYCRLCNQIQFSLQQIAGILLFIQLSKNQPKQKIAKKLTISQSSHNINNKNLVEFLINLGKYEDERQVFQFLNEGTFAVSAYLLNHIYYFWQKADFPASQYQEFQIFKQEMRLTKERIFNNKDKSPEVKHQTVKLLEKNLRFVDLFEANQNLKRIFKMFCLFSKQVSQYLSKIEYKIRIIDLIIFVILAYKIYSCFQKILPFIFQHFTNEGLIVLKQILYVFWNHDRRLAKSIILSVCIYSQMNAAIEQQKLLSMLKELGKLVRNNFSGFKHNANLDHRFIFILDYIEINILRIIRQSTESYT